MMPAPSGSPARRWVAPLALFFFGTLAFALITADMLYHGRLQQADRPIHIFFHERSTPPLMYLFSAISGLGEFVVIAGIAVLIGIALIRKKKWRSLACWAVALIGSGIINPVLKNYFKVPRPGDFTFYVFKPDAGYSYPSGHTMAVAITAGALALVVLHNGSFARRKNWMAAAIVAAISLLEAFALLYIGVHYLTDVLAALAVSAAWLGVIRWLLPPAVSDVSP